MGTLLKKRLTFLSRTEKKIRIIKKVPIIIAEKKSANGRSYSMAALASMKLQISENPRMFGQIGHNENSFIDLSKVSHRITNPVLEKTILFADINLMSTPMGDILAEGFKKNPKYAVFRPYGYGTVDMFGRVDEFKMISISAIDPLGDPYKGLL